jgi:hypothetical protein
VRLPDFGRCESAEPRLRRRHRLTVQPRARLRLPLAYKVVQTSGVLAAALTVGLLLGLIPAWKVGYWSVASRVHYTAVTLGAVAFIWFLNYLKLLGWRYHLQ